MSVVVPCRNEAGTLDVCLEALLMQDMPRDRYEVILVDGQSTDGSRECAATRGVTVVDDPGRGVSAARNLGIRAARAPLVAFTDADCVPRSDWLTRLLEVARERPDAAGVAGALRMPRHTLLGRMEDDDARLFYRGHITSNVAYRKDVLDAVGGFDERLCCAEDADLAWRILDAGWQIVHDARPIVIHAPPEINGKIGSYLAKQLWYARNDVPAHVRALARARGAPFAAPGAARATRGLRGAAIGACSPAALVAGAAAGAPTIAALGLGLAAADAAQRIGIVHGAVRLDPGEMAARVAVQTAKTLVRGVGTIIGFADLARAPLRAIVEGARPKRALVGRGAPWQRALS